MIKRVVEISQQPLHLSVRHGQLVLQARYQPPDDAKTIPCEDVGIVVVDEPGTSWSHAAMARLIDHGAAVVVCGKDHLPAGLLLPLSTHSEVVKRITEQIEAKLPLKKRLWKQLVVAKVKAQARVVAPNDATHTKLLALAKTVRSGDPANIEAQAAKAYWRAWLDTNPANDNQRFRRDPDGPPPNNLLNYGYAILRAAVARAIVSAGLHPALGLHHTNRSNPFCLADDLMEPLRPFVDDCARRLHNDGVTELDQPAKGALLELLATPCRLTDQTGPLMVSLHRMVASLVACYQGMATGLEIPEQC